MPCAAAAVERQLAAEQDHDITVCVVEKGSEIGAHILSGAVLEPRGPDHHQNFTPASTPQMRGSLT